MLFAIKKRLIATQFKLVAFSKDVFNGCITSATIKEMCHAIDIITSIYLRANALSNMLVP